MELIELEVYNDNFNVEKRFINTEYILSISKIKMNHDKSKYSELIIYGGGTILITPDSFSKIKESSKLTELEIYNYDFQKEIMFIAIKYLISMSKVVMRVDKKQFSELIMFGGTTINITPDSFSKIKEMSK